METTFQNLLLYILNTLKAHNYRKIKDCCFEEVFCDHQSTCYWRKKCTIKEFILQNIKKDTDFEKWRQLTNPKDQIDTIVKHISDTEYSEFLSIYPNKMYIAFRNGIYDMLNNVFLSFHERNKWNQQICAYNFIDQEFRLVKSTHTEIYDAFRQLGICEDTIEWFCILCGRYIFPLNKFERWKIMPFFWTNDCSDVSALNFFLEIFSLLLNNVTHLSTTSSHALEHIMHHRLAILLFRDLPPLDQGDWQSATVGEHVSISNSKGSLPYAYLWKTYFLGVGRNIPFKNDAGTVDRRVIMFDFSKITSDMFFNLKTVITKNIDIFAQIITENYLIAAKKYEDCEIWSENVLPKPIHLMRDKLKELSNPLYYFLISSTFTHSSDVFMPLNMFKDLYQEFRKKIGLNPQRWQKDHWHHTFQDLNLTIEHDQRDYFNNRTTTYWIIGIDTQANKRNEAESLNVTMEQLQIMASEKDKMRASLEKLERQYTLSQQLLIIETEICQLKEQRSIVRRELINNFDS